MPATGAPLSKSWAAGQPCSWLPRPVPSQRRDQLATVGGCSKHGLHEVCPNRPDTGGGYCAKLSLNADYKCSGVVIMEIES